jgi:hypothetical protein
MLLLTNVKGIVVEAAALGAFLIVVAFAVKRARRLEWLKLERSKMSNNKSVLSEEHSQA